MSKNGFRGFGPFNFAVALTFLIVASSIFLSGWAVIVPLAVLAVIEIIFSFEAAVINSQVLSTMRRIWRVVFLTVGILIAIFLVRAILPVALVAASLDESISYVWNLALDQPEQYAHELEKAYPVIAAYGGVFLLMVGLRFFGERRRVLWLDSIEAPLGEFNQPWWFPAAGAVVAISLIYTVLAPGETRVAVAGILGALTFFGIKLLGKLLMGRQSKHSHGTHRHGLSQFLYLEVLDASFSFDSVIAAFAITTNVVLITAGLAIGAIFVRSMTIQLLKTGTLREYRYLIHGAHYTILALAVLLLAGIRYNIPEAVAGVIGIIIIFTAFNSSRRHNKLAAGT
jgi:uncharacterized protein